MHEHIDGSVTSLDQLFLQPVQSRSAELSLVHAGAVFGRIKKEENTIVCDMTVLHEAIVVLWMVGEDGLKDHAIIMISDQQETGQVKFCKAGLEKFIGLDLSKFRQIP